MIVIKRDVIDKPDWWNSDEFLSMDYEEQVLFFHYYVRAKDRIVSNPVAIARMVGVDEDVIENLEKDGYIEDPSIIDKLNNFCRE